jgi:phenylacetate-CoA ligase
MSRDPLTTKWGQLPRRAVRELQAKKLQRYLQDVVLPFSAHYQRIFRACSIRPQSIRTLDDLARLPFTSKSDLTDSEEHTQHIKDYLLVPNPQMISQRLSSIIAALVSGKEFVRARLENEFRPVFMTSTTGRSADPIPFLYSNHDLQNLSNGGRRIMQVCGARRDFRLLNMFPYAPHLAFWLTHYASTSFGAFSVGTGGGKVMGTDGCLRMLSKIKPDVVIGMPTFVYHVLLHAIEQGCRFEGIKRLVLGGEKTADGMRKKLRSMCRTLGSPNTDVVATYGFTEAKMAWAECPVESDENPSGYHLYPDFGIFEVVDPKSGTVMPDGEPGELVYTPLDARGTVVLRYRTGDMIDGGMTYEPCPHCGRSLPRLLGNISRVSEVRSMQFDKIKGTLVDFNKLEHVLDDAQNVGAWQLVIRKFNDDPLEVDELVLYIHNLNNVAEDKLTHELNIKFGERMEIRPNRIVFRQPEQMRTMLGVGTQMKEQKVVDCRPQIPPKPMQQQMLTVNGHGLSIQERR